MKTLMKLGVLLAITDSLASSFRESVKDYIRYFKGSQGDFKGIRKTYTPLPETDDYPSERTYKKVVTTVDEKLEWFEDTNTKYLQSVFNLEHTNAVGNVVAPLVVEGETVAIMSSLELLRLKGILENGEFVAMLENIPVRSDSEIWNHSVEEGRGIVETPLLTGKKTTTDKESYIISDPNLDKLKPGTEYRPQIGVKTVGRDLGHYTVQHFSGEWSHKQRAETLKRRQILHTAVIEALKKANEEALVVESDFKVDKFFDYLLGR